MACRRGKLIQSYWTRTSRLIAIDESRLHETMQCVQWTIGWNTTRDAMDENNNKNFFILLEEPAPRRTSSSEGTSWARAHLHVPRSGGSRARVSHDALHRMGLAELSRMLHVHHRSHGHLEMLCGVASLQCHSRVTLLLLTCGLGRAVCWWQLTFLGRRRASWLIDPLQRLQLVCWISSVCIEQEIVLLHNMHNPVITKFVQGVWRKCAASPDLLREGAPEYHANS